MTLPPHILDKIYARAMPANDYFVLQADALDSIQRVVAQRFVDAIDAVMLEEMEEIVSDD